jgi:hypothetical protein
LPANQKISLRLKLQGEQKNLSGELAACKVLAVASADMSQQISKKRDALHAEMLLRHDHSIWKQAIALQSVSTATWIDEQHFWLAHHGRSIFAQQNLQISIGIGIFIFVLLFFLHASLAKIIYRTLNLTAPQHNFYHYISLLAGVVAVATATDLTNTLSPLIALILGTWGGYIFISMLLALALSSSGVVSRHLPWRPHTLRPTLRTLRFIATLSVFGLTWVNISPNDPLSPIGPLFFWSIYHLVVLGAVFWLVWQTGDRKSFRAYSLLRILILLALIATAIFTIIGYRNLSNYMFFGLLMSLLAFGVGLFFSWTLADFWIQTAQNPAAGNISCANASV